MTRSSAKKLCDVHRSLERSKTSAARPLHSEDIINKWTEQADNTLDRRSQCPAEEIAPVVPSIVDDCLIVKPVLGYTEPSVSFPAVNRSRVIDYPRPERFRNLESDEKSNHETSFQQPSLISGFHRRKRFFSKQPVLFLREKYGSTAMQLPILRCSREKSVKRFALCATVYKRNVTVVIIRRAVYVFLFLRKRCTILQSFSGL